MLAVIVHGVSQKKSIQHLHVIGKVIGQCQCNWPNAFSHAIGMFNAAGNLERAVSPPAGPGVRGKAPENFEICSKIRLETGLSKQIFMHIKSPDNLCVFLPFLTEVEVKLIFLPC